jgi:hypothetical protein
LHAIAQASAEQELSMSDVTVAPNAAPPPSNAPAANEVAINQNPTNAPQPVGSQAPEKTVEPRGSEHRPESRREAIQRAFAKARETNPPKAAEAKMGHNQPPEETKREVPARAKPEREKLEPIDLRKRPTADQPRDQGRFARAEPDNTGQQQPRQQQPQQRGAPGAQTAAQTAQTAQLPETAPYRNAPQRMTERAKAEWGTTPESVRADVYRMHTEFDGAYKRYKGDHETMKTIRPFERMAKEHGTTLERALNNYVGMEQKLRTDVVGGLDIIVNNLNLRTPDGERLTLRDVAYHILNQSPEQHKLRQNENAQSAQSQQIGQLHQMVSTLASGIKEMQYERQFANTRTAIDRYAEDPKHPRFDELADLIEQEIKLGFDIDTAYQRAEMLRPASPRAAQTRTNGNGTQAQARPVDRSIHGAPDAGPSNGTSRGKGGKQIGRREAIASAIKRVSGSL